MKLSVPFIREALPQSDVVFEGKDVVFTQGASELSPSECLELPEDIELAIDSRLVKPGNAFIALQGEKTNGHNFLAQAFQNGARIFIIEKKYEDALKYLPPSLQPLTIIKVRDTLQALFAMAQWWRARFSYPVIGITGSVGKTTTKEMLKTILEKAHINAHVSYKNQNSITGLPLNMLNMKKEHAMAVFELGAHKLGDIGLFADILQPTTALITSIAHSHVAHLGSLREIAHQKKQIFKNFKPDTIGIIGGDVPLLSEAHYPHPVIRFGLKTRNQVQARRVKVHQTPAGDYATDFLLRIYDQEAPVRLASNHSGYLYNALGAAALAYHLQVPLDIIVAGLQAFKTVDGRFSMKQMKDERGFIIDDCYNANPESMKAALMAFHSMKVKGQKIAVIGDMREQGEKEAFWHRQVGRIFSKASSISTVILVGPLAKEIDKVAPVSINRIIVNTWQEAVEALKPLVKKEFSHVLVKASRGVHLENVVQAFTE